ncbi:xanthine dehydrogenase family protein molybdopterin-binding subunit [Mucilaginibacter sp. AW1-3]
MKKSVIGEPMDRVDGRLKVTGAATYSAEHKIPNLVYGVLVPGTIASGTITSLDTKAAEAAPGVLTVISHLNAPQLQGFQPSGTNTNGKPTYRVFGSDRLFFNGQPIALIVADTFERATHAASLVKATYQKDEHKTNLEDNMANAVAPGRGRDYQRGIVDAYKTAPVIIEQTYTLPTEVHSPMELHNTTAFWEGDKVTVFTKSQGVKATQQSIMNTFKLTDAQVQVNSRFVGGAFGSSLRTWPHEIATVMAAKKVGRPVKLMLTREQMFTSVGYRPKTVQKIGLGAAADGQLIGITHESYSQTAVYEEFTEGSNNVSRFLYASPNVTTRYKIIPLNVGVPAPMRGPGEATGAYAIESALDELSYKLNMDPIALRLKNYAENDPERNLPYSSKYLKECYSIGAEKIGWSKRSQIPGSVMDGDWLVGFGIGCGVFGAHRGKATAKIRISADGTVNIQCATADIGPGTATSMTLIAADALGLPPEKITFELGNSSFPQAGQQGGSSTVSSVGSAVHDVSLALKKKLMELSGKTENDLSPGQYTDILKQQNLPYIEITQGSQGGDEGSKYSMYSFSAHFCEVRVHPITGQVKVVKAVAAVDAGTIINHKTAGSQMIGGVVGGIGMALTEEALFDDRYGRYINGNFADYHVPVHADVPQIEVVFIDKPDPVLNPMGTKGIGEISIIGFAPAIANAVYNATGKRVREMPITPDKLI